MEFITTLDITSMKNKYSKSKQLIWIRIIYKRL